MPEIILTDEHRYYVDGIEYDSVTNILRAEGFMSNYVPADLDWYMERGTKIHKATEMYDKDMLLESSLIPKPGFYDIRPFFESWKKYQIERSKTYAPCEIEIQLFDPVYQYAGTLDRIDLDIKTGQSERWHIFQVAAYNKLAKLNGRLEGPDRTVCLQEDGSYPKVKIYTPAELRRAYETFLCALNVYRSKREMGI